MTQIRFEGVHIFNINRIDKTDPQTNKSHLETVYDLATNNKLDIWAPRMRNTPYMTISCEEDWSAADQKMKDLADQIASTLETPVDQIYLNFKGKGSDIDAIYCIYDELGKTPIKDKDH